MNSRFRTNAVILRRRLSWFRSGLVRSGTKPDWTRGPPISAVSWGDSVTSEQSYTKISLTCSGHLIGSWRSHDWPSLTEHWVLRVYLRGTIKRNVYFKEYFFWWDERMWTLLSLSSHCWAQAQTQWLCLSFFGLIDTLMSDGLCLQDKRWIELSVGLKCSHVLIMEPSPANQTLWMDRNNQNTLQGRMTRFFSWSCYCRQKCTE